MLVHRGLEPSARRGLDLSVVVGRKDALDSEQLAKCVRRVRHATGPQPAADGAPEIVGGVGVSLEPGGLRGRRPRAP